jgi:hypothetical protein
MNQDAGRNCPLQYRYGASALASSPIIETHVLYVVGGLYGNIPALDSIEQLAQHETQPVNICFNGDFNWFNVDASSFETLNHRVLQHSAIQGNVEAELGDANNGNGCGCGYPNTVDDGTVERSNRIHSRLKATADKFPHIVSALSQLPMYARYKVGDCTVGVVHGDAESLAGWGFDATEVHKSENQAWLASMFVRAEVDIFASSHTCAPAMRHMVHANKNCIVMNNGASGMPNFHNTQFGLITRIGRTPSPHLTCYGNTMNGIFVDALPVHYNSSEWIEQFLANWPPGSDAYMSYFERINAGTAMDIASVNSIAVGDTC